MIPRDIRVDGHIAQPRQRPRKLAISKFDIIERQA